MKDCLDNQVQNALTIPYFEGDFWSNIIEESIKGTTVGCATRRRMRERWISSLVELDQEEEERRKKEEVEAARAIEDGGFDDPIEAEDPTDVSRRSCSRTQCPSTLVQL